MFELSNYLLEIGNKSFDALNKLWTEKHEMSYFSCENDCKAESLYGALYFQG